MKSEYFYGSHEATAVALSSFILHTVCIKELVFRIPYSDLGKDFTASTKFLDEVSKALRCKEKGDGNSLAEAYNYLCIGDFLSYSISSAENNQHRIAKIIASQWREHLAYKYPNYVFRVEIEQNSEECSGYKVLFEQMSL